MSKTLPYSMKDVRYDNGKFRQRSCSQALSQAMLSSNVKRNCIKCSTGRMLLLMMTIGLTFLLLNHDNKFSKHSLSKAFGTEEKENLNADGSSRFSKFWRKPPRIPPRLTPDEMNSNRTSESIDSKIKWQSRQEDVKKAFIHAWYGYKTFAIGYDELMPISQRGSDGLGGLGATVVDALDTAIIMGVDDIVYEAGSWIENNLPNRIREKGNVNLFETTIRVLGGLLSAYHLQIGKNKVHKGPNEKIYLENAKNLADHLLTAFTSSPTVIPFSDVVLKDNSSHTAPDGLSSTSEVSTLQLEFNYLSFLTGDPKYSLASMKVLEHLKTLPKTEGLVPIRISPQTGQFSGENIRLGSRGDSYYEYLIKVWLQDRDANRTYLYDMYTEAMKGVKHLLVRKSVPNELVFVGELPYGTQGSFSSKMDHLVCFLPGTLALGATKGLKKEIAMKNNLLNFEDLENLKLAEDLVKSCYEMYEVTSTGLAPEIAYFNIEANSGDEGHDGGNKDSKYAKDIKIMPLDRHSLLRPETVESLFVLYRITENPIYREWGWEIFKAFEKYAKVKSGGYTSLSDVTTMPPRKRDKMETFFLGETLKYLYLLFGEDNVIPLDEFVFNTEAHPLPIHRGNVQSQ